MDRDFTLKKYRDLLETVTNTDYSAITVSDYMISAPDRCIILRHDVDRAVRRSLNMAKLEYEYDIASTYYFRYKKDVFDPQIIQEIADMGHEIGFHYEVMDKAKGDHKKAIEIFKNELDELRDIVDISTVCMHGNPLASWSNLDLWETYDFKDFGVIGEPYISIDYGNVLYLTDTGRTWSNRNVRVKDVVKSEGADNIQLLDAINSTDDVIKLINSERLPLICILAHPNRWCDDLAGWSIELVLQNIKNIGKAGIVWYRNQKRDNLQNNSNKNI